MLPGKVDRDQATISSNEMDADSELTRASLGISGLVRIAASGTFGRLHVLPLIPNLLSLNPGLRVDFALSDIVCDMIEDRIDLAIRVGPVYEPEAVVRRVATTPLVCVAVGVSLTLFVVGRDAGRWSDAIAWRSEPWRTISGAIRAAGSIALASAWMAAFALLFNDPSWRQRLAGFAAVAGWR